MDPGPLLATTHDAGGLKVKLRLARPSDGLRLRAFLEAERPVLAARAGAFTFYDPRERLVIAATAPVDGSEAIVGLAVVEFGPPLVIAREPEVAKLLTATAVPLIRRLRHAA